MIPLREALIRLAEEQTPGAAVREYLKPPPASSERTTILGDAGTSLGPKWQAETRHDPFESPNPPGPAWDALEDARRDLGRQLWHGDLTAWAVLPDGRLVPIRVETWRTEGFAALRTGRMDGRDVLLPEVRKSLIPPMRLRLAALPAWLIDKHGMTEGEVQDVIVDLRRIPTRFRLAWVDDVFMSWGDLWVDWATCRGRDKRNPPDGPTSPLEVSLEAVTEAVARLRIRQRRDRLALQAPAPQKPEASERSGPRYTPDYQTLKTALATWVATTGLSAAASEIGICAALADGKIRSRVIAVDGSTGRERETYRADIPPHLMPADLDWEKSKPLEAWVIRRTVEQEYFGVGGNPAVQIRLLELHSDDVRAVLVSLTPEAPPPASSVKQPTIPSGKLRAAWKEYLARYPEADKRPNKDAQRAAMRDAFPEYAPPTERAMQQLRAHPITPPEWREQGRRPKSDKKSN